MGLVVGLKHGLKFFNISLIKRWVYVPSLFLAALALPCCEQTLVQLWHEGLVVLQDVGF